MAPETRADGSFPDPEPDEAEDQLVPLPHTPLPPHTKEGFFGPKTELPETPLAKKVLPTQVQTAEDYRKWDERGREWLYGFVWFCQKKDRSVTRGYMQVSCENRIGCLRQIADSFEVGVNVAEYRHPDTSTVSLALSGRAGQGRSDVF